MINYLKDIKKETLIGLLPDVINSNNESIRNEFNWIFDSSLNRLIKSVYAPTGSVKAHFGEFTNLACEYFTVKNVDSLKNSIQRATEKVISETLNTSSMLTVMAALTNIANSSFIDPSLYDISALCDISTLIVNHNVLNHRFINSEFEESNYMHDADSIIYEINDGKYTTVKDVLDTIDTIDTSIQEAYDLAKNCDASINEFAENIQECNNEINDVKTTIETTNSSINTAETNIQELSSAINELSDDVEVVEQSIETTNSSIRKINTSINNLSNTITDLDERNSNNIILDDIYDEIVITKNQYNFIATPISDNKAIIEIKFDDDINHEYNFKFILNTDVEAVYIHNDEWYNPGDNTTLYINCDNNRYYIDYNESDNLFIIRRDNINNSAMCDITLNRYANDKDGTTICMLYCKVYNLYIPS